MSSLIVDKDFLSQGIKLTNNILDYPDGIIISINKPYRWTSADVIRKIKYIACKHFGKKNLKVGHAGTLDPLASGVLLVCIGPATRQAEALQKADKEYIATLTFGATTPSFDAEKPIDKFYPIAEVTEQNIIKALNKFTGEIEQVAPLFSAKSVDGIRAYEIARKLYRSAKEGGEDMDHSIAQVLNKQHISIFSNELISFNRGDVPNSGIAINIDSIQPQELLSDVKGKNSRIKVYSYSFLHLPQAVIRVACSKGTYIRALARDIGEELNSGAYLSALERSRSGEFSVNKAVCIEDVVSRVFSTI